MRIVDHLSNSYQPTDELAKLQSECSIGLKGKSESRVEILKHIDNPNFSSIIKGYLITSMLLKESQKQEIRLRLQKLSLIIKNPTAMILLFEILGTALLSYGICATHLKHPIQRQVQNSHQTFYISCLPFFSIAVSLPFSGGHLNPSVTIGFIASGLTQKKQIGFYALGQLLGAIIGVAVYDMLVGPAPEIYSDIVLREQVMLDALSEIFGTLIFVFGNIYTWKRNYMSEKYFKYFFIVIMLLLGRTYTFRKGCLNPAMAIAFQLFASINHSNVAIFPQVYGIIIGSTIGGLLAAVFYDQFYEQILDSLENKQNTQSNHDDV